MIWSDTASYYTKCIGLTVPSIHKIYILLVCLITYKTHQINQPNCIDHGSLLESPLYISGHEKAISTAEASCIAWKR